MANHFKRGANSLYLVEQPKLEPYFNVDIHGVPESFRGNFGETLVRFLDNCNADNVRISDDLKLLLLRHRI